jgi:DNA-nicking Smr family endonuclease
MKPPKSIGIFRPFENLKALLESKCFSIPRYPFAYKENSIVVKPEPENEKRLFLDAMTGVRPITRDKYIKKNNDTLLPYPSKKDSGDETILRLNNLVKYGEGFMVSDTPEYIEGSGYCVNPAIIDRLHRGDFSIQDHIDLHGLNVEEARGVFENFLKEAIKTGKRAVLIVHGRGLSSPSEPVLKSKVIAWLTSSHWRKWIIAFSSARLCDGGAGATYVLLRQRPMTKSQRKRKKHNLTSRKLTPKERG